MLKSEVSRKIILSFLSYATNSYFIPLYQYTFPYSVNLVQISLNDLDSFFGNIDSNFFKGRYTILFLVWESEYIAPELAENLNLFNEIWTTSAYCKSIFEKNYNNPIIIVPHPVEVALSPIESQNKIEFFDKKKFSFLFLFSYHSSVERKNPFFLLNAFTTAFANKDDVELVIKTVGASDYRKVKKRLLHRLPNNIKIQDTVLDKNNVNHLINECDAYVSLHHAEGFGLTLAEAMYLGKPVIATNYSGNTEFMNEDNSFLVKYKLATIEKPDRTFCAKTLWADPLLEDAVEKLQLVYNNSVLRQEKAAAATQSVKAQLSFAAIGSIMKDRVVYLYANFDELAINHQQQAYFMYKLQSIKAENQNLKREIRRMKKNKIIVCVLFLKNMVRKLKKRKVMMSSES